MKKGLEIEEQGSNLITAGSEATFKTNPNPCAYPFFSLFLTSFAISLMLFSNSIMDTFERNPVLCLGQ